MKSVLTAVLLSVPVWAQPPAGGFQVPPPPGTRAHMEEDVVMFFDQGPMHAAKPVKGAPYSAESIVETTQTLADGNHIRHRRTSRVWRDSEGRTRFEESMEAPPGWSGGVEFQHVRIEDPVAGMHLMLNPHTKTARKFSIPAPGASPAGELMIWQEETMAGVRREVFIQKRVITTGGQPSDVREEEPGKRVVEGVMAEGKRTVRVIPAGQEGNDRPIEIISETWFSPELKLPVFSRREDPRFGETVTRLANIQRAEPDPALFQVPPDFTLVDASQPVRIQLEKKR